MRLDHIAYRVHDRKAAAQFFIEALGYRVQQEFQLKFDNDTTADCIALEPGEKIKGSEFEFRYARWSPHWGDSPTWTYHLAPELFVSDGVPGSIVHDWVTANGPGIHHMAYQVKSVQATMDEWLAKGYAEFASADPLTCPGLVQVFTKPSAITGVIYEFIERGEHGFCAENVKALMESTHGL